VGAILFLHPIGHVGDRFAVMNFVTFSSSHRFYRLKFSGAHDTKPRAADKHLIRNSLHLDGIETTGDRSLEIQLCVHL
jgi:hypothetical protein